ncbi:hypothetical protein [Xenorhabdus anantnagensis]|uniref:JmjC domain-containing protein n=1 Tax=Xenorhabdus anantnagensis TaxID=3025875 RepID=A0ABT5LTP3_9GAMM|nr:hypothetical protein [Xenorhabdus anantnagensis]MDC9597096.1 hypothetical protein [Xenorhabdus anantnagensis]
MWKEIYTESKGLIGPYLVRDLKTFPLSFEHISSALNGVKWDQSPSKMNYFRGYVGGKEDYSLAERFLEYDLAPESIEKSIFNAFAGETPQLGENAGLIVNGSLQWSEILQETAGIHAEEIALLYPNQQITFDVILFIGAYGSTPFGVHIDDSSHRTILFNLGPGEKGIALWQNEDILKQFGKVRNILNPASIHADPEKYFFKPGEAFVLPSERYHVGLNSTLSTAVAIVVDIVSAGKAVAREAQNIGSFFDVMSEMKKCDVRHLSFEDLIWLNSLRNASNHYLRYSPAKKFFDMSAITERTTLRPSKSAGVKIAPLNHTTLVYSRGYHHVYEQVLEESIFDHFLQKEIFDVQNFLSLLSGGRETLKQKLLLLKFFIDTGTFEVLQ